MNHSVLCLALFLELLLRPPPGPLVGADDPLGHLVPLPLGCSGGGLQDLPGQPEPVQEALGIFRLFFVLFLSGLSGHPEAGVEAAPQRGGRLKGKVLPLDASVVHLGSGQDVVGVARQVTLTALGGQQELQQAMLDVMLEER